MKKIQFVAIQIAAVAGLLLILELVLRLFGYPYKDYWAIHPIYHHQKMPSMTGLMTKPGEFSEKITINRHGLRGPECAFKKDPGVFRVLMLGDSFTEGYGVSDEKNFCHLSEKYLNEHLPGTRRFEVLNAGHCGYSTILEYLYYKNFAYQFNADLVLLFFDWGDIQDDFRYSRQATRNREGVIVAVPVKEYTGAAVRGLARRVAILNYLYWQNPGDVFRRKIMAKGLKTMLGKERYDHIKRKYFGTQSSIRIGDLESDRFLIFRDGYEETLKPHLDLTQDYIKKLAEAAKQNGSAFALVLYPYGVQLNAREWVDGKEFYGFETNRVYGDRTPFRIFEDFARENGIKTINLYDAFKNSPEFPLFYAEDGHLTAKANDLVAQTLKKEILLTRDTAKSP